MAIDQSLTEKINLKEKRIRELSDTISEKNAEINSLLSKLEDVKLMNKELDDLLNQFQNDMHDIQIELNTKVGNEDI